MQSSREQEALMLRKYIDCREMPSESGCDLAMAGSDEHLLDAAVIHAVTAHGHEDTPELRDQIRQLLKDEVPGALA
jgi:predicted small metal-binding protein